MEKQNKLEEWAHRTEESYSPETVEVMARVREKFMVDSFAGDYGSINMKDPDVQDLADKVKSEKFQTLISRDDLRETLVNQVSSAKNVTDIERAKTPAELTKFRLNQLSDYRESLGDNPIVDDMPDYSAKRADIERFVDDTIMGMMLNDQVTHGSQTFATKESADLLLGDGPIDVMYELQMDNQSDLAVFATVSENYPADEQVVFDRMQAGRLVYHHSQQGYRNIDYALESYDNALIASQQSNVELTDDILPELKAERSRLPRLPDDLPDFDVEEPKLPPLPDLDVEEPKLPPLPDLDVEKSKLPRLPDDLLDSKVERSKLPQLTNDDLLDLKAEEPRLPRLTDDDLPDWDVDEPGLKQ